MKIKNSVSKAKSSKELKKEAKIALTGNYTIMIVSILIIGVLSAAANGQIRLSSSLRSTENLLLLFFIAGLSIIFSIIIYIASYFLQFGMIYMALKISRHEKARIEDLFYAFTHRPKKVLAMCLLKLLIFAAGFIPYFIFAAVGMFLALFHNAMIAFYVLLGIGAVITLVVDYYFLLRLMLSVYIFIDNTELGVVEILKKSAYYMKGNVRRALYLGVSFIGLYVLGIFTCFIGFYWIRPYMHVTFAGFYNDIVRPAKPKPDWRPFISYAG